MGRIKKVAGPKHEATISPALSQFAQKATTIPLPELPSYLATFPRRWPFPRGDLYHWIAVLNRFDDILQSVIEKYALGSGPQTRAFDRSVLEEACLSSGIASSYEECERKLNELGFGAEGDRELVEVLLDFSRLLLEKCGNRSLFTSSERLNDLLNTTSLSLLQCALRLGVNLSQRYYSRQRTTNSSHFHQTLLATHYNIDIERVQKLASPFPRPTPTAKPTDTPTSAKGKEKVSSTSQSSQRRCNANDLISLSGASVDNTGNVEVSDTDGSGLPNWEEWGSVRMSYYHPAAEYGKEQQVSEGGSGAHTFQAPSTPTPLRRTTSAHQSTSSHQSSRLSRTSSADQSPLVPTSSPAAKPDESARGMKVVEIPNSIIRSTKIEKLLQDHLEDIPKDSRYEFLNRLRVAYAMSAGPETRRQILAIRILAITNLAHIYPDSMFQQKILQLDSDEPKRLQLAYQLAEMVHLGVTGDIDVSIVNQTFALYALEALSKHKSRASDVCAALNVNVNHGILMFITRKAVSELAVEDAETDTGDTDDWRDALLALLRTLPNAGSRTADTLVSAGLIQMLVDVLNIRTQKARRVYPRVMEFIDTFVHSVPNALATLASAKGFDAISDLVSVETSSAFDLVQKGAGLSAEYRTPAIDYQIPYFHQQSLRWLFKFVNHVMQHNNTGFERLLRNLIDSPPLLTALRTVLENARIYGSHVWSGAVNIMSHFIHNEPTSYAVISEAGLSKSFLEAVMVEKIESPHATHASDSEESSASTITQPSLFVPSDSGTADRDAIESKIARTLEQPLAGGILPSTEAIVSIPGAFGAICLNSSGLKLFQSTNALERFFDIFESPAHVECMKNDPNLLRILGNTFDELVRHHPPLKSSIMNSILLMVARVGRKCKMMAVEGGFGTKLWINEEDGKLSVAGGAASLACNIGAVGAGNGGDTEMDTSDPPKVDGWDSKDRDDHGLSVSNYIYPAVRFLSSFFENQTCCANYVEAGGAEYIIDFATLPSLPFDFHNTESCQNLAQVMHLMVETKAHLVLPSLVHRTQDAVNVLKSFWEKPGGTGFFSPLTSAKSSEAPVSKDVTANGTYIAKHLVSVHVLTDLLRESFSPPIYTTRPSQMTSPFVQVNLADRYEALVSSLGSLHSACVWEEILLQKNMPEAWNEATKVPTFGVNADDINEFPPLPPIDDASEPGDATSEVPERDTGESGQATGQSTGDQRPQDETRNPSAPGFEKSAAFKNSKILRYLLSSLPSSITGFFHLLGHGLVSKRRMDTYQRQKSGMVADAIASMVLTQLNLEAAKECSCLKDRFSYLIVILSSFSQLLFNTTTERPHSHCLTMVLAAFKKISGLQELKNLCQLFLSEIKALGPHAQEDRGSQDVPTRLASAYGGIKIILTFFTEITSARYIVDSVQTQSMASNERDRDRPDYFLPAQFLVELRMDVLPTVQELWSSSFVEDASSSIVKSLIDILRATLDAEYEHGAFHRGDSLPPLSSVSPKIFTVHRDRLSSLKDRGYGEDLAREGLYRCNNVSAAADEYCAAQRRARAPPRNPIPAHDLEMSSRVSSASRGDPVFGMFGETQGDNSPAPPLSRPDNTEPIASLLGQIQAPQPGASGESAQAEGPREHQNGPGDEEATNNSGLLAMSIDNLLNARDQAHGEEPQSSGELLRRPSAQQAPRRRELATVDDLDDERDKVRSNLIERCLDVLNVHHDVTFELADLVNSATAKLVIPDDFRKEVGETLIHSLISLQMEEDFHLAGKKIAAYANLLALVLQESTVYEATFEDLRDNFSSLLGFIKIPPAVADKPTQESCPWIGQVLLILERVLSEDANPPIISWSPPNPDDPIPSEEPVNLRPSAIAVDDKIQLFESIVEILPRIGKDDSLALSVSRILVILTRNREIASRLGGKRNLQRLFVMIKQLASSSNDKLQSAFMLILRHVVEDDDTIRQIMRSEIVAYFSARSARQVDTTGYTRQFYHLALRSPQLFVEVTNEKIKLLRYDSQQRPQQLTLKPEKDESKDNPLEDSATADKKEDGDKQAESSETKATAQEDNQTEVKEPKEKGKAVELKTPVVENPDGVIHYLLSELLSYRDVDDKQTQPDIPGKTGDRRPDVDVGGNDASAPYSSSETPRHHAHTEKKPEKPQFKAEDHPIYIYRCFLLQCLTELLSSYNRTKVEFINFSRKADPLATTPSKPRSGILNYLLHSLVPIGTLEHEESVQFKKRLNTSSWAMKVIVALCAKTSESISPRNNRNAPVEEDQPELLFVRKFVLEHALKAYKDANSSQEPLDVKYARLLSLADLFDKMLAGNPSPDGHNNLPSSSRQVAKTMFDKNFISAFTASVAEIDLNFPGSKRAVKYILRPLNKLTQIAVLLSETGSIQTPPGDADEDEISSATSVSDLEDDREETPDLFRHSTLGMFEPNHEDATSSEESGEDDEMYDDEYDDEMDYEEELPEDDGEVVSDEDEELGSRGPIEGLPGDSGMDIEVLLEGEDEDEDDEDESDEEEDDEDEEGSDMEDDEIMAGEITGDNDNDSLHGGHEDEWESEEMSDEDGDDDGEMIHHFESELDDLPPGHPIHEIAGDHPQFGSLLRALGGGGGATIEHLDSDAGMERDMHDEMMGDDDMNEDEDEEVDIDDLEEELDDLEDGEDHYGFDDDAQPPWIMDEGAPHITVHRHHGAGRMRGLPTPFSLFSQGMPHRHGALPMPGYRTHRNQIPARGNDDGINPLLRRVDRPADASGERRPPGTEAFSDWVHAIDTGNQGRLVSVDSPVTFFNEIMQAITQGAPGFGVVSGPDGLHVRLDQGNALGERLQSLVMGRQHGPSGRSRDDPSQAVTFSVTTTTNRWQEEARLLYSSAYVERAQRIVNSLLRVLVPPAIEEEKVRQKQLEEELKRREEERKERERQEKIAKEEEEKERKRKEEEEEAARRQQEEERAAEERARQPEERTEDEPMEDVQPTEAVREGEEGASEAPAEAGPSEPAARVHTTIRGRQLDITGMEIDPEYLEALPEEIREEVIMQQLAEQRSQAAASGEEPSEINPEFLEALPPEIREELLQQEAADRRRREREASRREAAASGTAGPEEMDPASFIATLDPSLRQTVLADQPEEVLASLGPEFLSEARALTQRRFPHFGDGSRLDRAPRTESHHRDEDTKKPQRRQIVQMLDKAGVATLLRLMFMPLNGNARHLLNDILHNVCQNRQNRSEVLSLLLLILQDGSADVSAVERSFAHLSLRARTPSSGKTPQTLKRTLSLPVPGSNTDVTPLVVIQQCLGALSFLTQYNPHISWFFITEHEAVSSLKMKALRKGKFKENRANRFALNSLLSLLDRKSIMDSPSCMEQLSNLLSHITQPLTLLLRKEKEKQEIESKGKEVEGAEPKKAETQTQPSEENGAAAVTGEADTAMPDVATAESAEKQEEGGPSVADKKEESKPIEEEKQKKQRTLEAPTVPEYNLRLVVHILAARECNGKVFRETLSTINNLSAIPGAKEVIGRELIVQAQALSNSILDDLAALLPHIEQAVTGTDVQGMALAKFSPASSDQAKFLRVLTALDYLFDPNRIDKDKFSEPESVNKEDVLKTLYESATFGPLWHKLSDCLSAIRQKDKMLNVATTLLPLIESLMVVCKNTTLKDAPLSYHGREFTFSSPPPDAGMEGLFFNFTENHRKILNELVRSNPKLMSGTFSLLVKNPKVLEFDNKRNYFNRRLRSRGAEARHPHPPLQLSIRRDQVFLDSFKSLYFKTAEEMKYGKLNIRFHGEEGVDAGGVSREWFQVLARGMFDPNYALFTPVASDRTTFHPNRLSGVNQEHLMFFKFIGRIIGKALYEGRVLDCHFSRAVYKRILGKSVSIKDMETLDLDYYKSLLWMLENDITDIITENFSVETDDFGETQVIDLIENGRNIPVTEENKEEYVQKVVEYRLTGSVKEQLDNFLRGFHDIVQADLIAIFNEQELELLISGLPEIDVDDWKNNSEYHNYSASSPQIQWYWRAVRSFDKEERAKLLQFVTGTSKVPLNGFKELEGMNGFSKFNIHRDYGNKDRLPSSHTCFNQLDLPEYDSYETLRQRLYTAMTAGSEYFGFA